MLKAKELTPLSRGDAIRALGEMQAHQETVLAEQQALAISFRAKQTELTTRAGFVDPNKLHFENPIRKEYLALETAYMNAKLDSYDYNPLSNQRTLTQLALDNPGQILN